MGLALAVLFALSLAISPAVSLADTTTTINFEEPVIPGTKSPESGPAVTTQYLGQGVEFVSPYISHFPEMELAGWARSFYAQPDLYRDDAHAHSGSQVLRDYGVSGEGCFNAFAQIFGRVSTETTKLEAYVGAEREAPVVLAGYDLSGQLISEQSKTVKAGKVEALMRIESEIPDIAYFSVAINDGGTCATPALEVDDLSFVVPSAPPPPQIALQFASSETDGGQGQTVSVPIAVARFNNASNPVDLSVSGLPPGVTLTGGNVIPEGSDTTELQFTVGPNAAPASSTYTVSATSVGVESPAPVQGVFTVLTALAIGLEQNEGLGEFTQLKTLELGPCSSASASITNLQVVPGSSTLALVEEGDTTGLTATLSTTSLARGSRATLHLSGNGTGGAGEARYTIVATMAPFRARRRRSSSSAPARRPLRASGSRRARRTTTGSSSRAARARRGTSIRASPWWRARRRSYASTPTPRGRPPGSRAP